MVWPSPCFITSPSISNGTRASPHGLGSTLIYVLFHFMLVETVSSHGTLHAEELNYRAGANPVIGVQHHFQGAPSWLGSRRVHRDDRSNLHICGSWPAISWHLCARRSWNLVKSLVQQDDRHTWRTMHCQGRFPLNGITCCVWRPRRCFSHIFVCFSSLPWLISSSIPQDLTGPLVSDFDLRDAVTLHSGSSTWTPQVES